MTSKVELPTGEGPRPMRKDAARNRELLIAAGRDVFAKRGLDASLDDIARQAGVGVGTAYRHFANKFDLAEAIMGEAIAEVVAAAHAAADVADPWPALVGFFETVLEIQTKDRGLREVLMGMGNPHKKDGVHDLLEPPIRAMLARAQESGAVRPEVVTSDLGCIVAMLCEISDFGADTAPHLWRRYFDVLLAGLRPGGPQLPGIPLTEQQFRDLAEQHHVRKSRIAAPA